MARETLARALDVARRVANGGRLQAECLARLGMVERSQQDFPAALRWFQQAMLILDAVDPNGFVTSSALTDLGNCEMFLGMLDDARNHTLRALRIREQLSAGLPQLFACISNLGIIELFAENLDAAEDYFERAVEIQEGLDDDPVKLAEALINRH